MPQNLKTNTSTVPPRCRTWVGVVWLLSVCAALADTDPAAFERGNLLYEKGEYTRAVEAYEKVMADGQVSASVHYNLGNALLLSGETGRAIVHYRLALYLSPRDPDVRLNLHAARGLVSGGVSPVMPRTAWLSRLSLREWGLVCIALIWVSCGLLSAAELKPRFARWRRWGGVAGGVWVLSLLVFATVWHERFGIQHAVVVHPSTVMHYGPLDESPALQTLPDGQELRVVDKQSGWLRVTGAAAGPGWVKRGDVLFLES